MPKNFKGANNSRAFQEVGKEYAEKGNVITLVNISTENLVDHPDNGEDISMTADLEVSISELGFIDPIEVTNRGMDEGKYMIVSGRRRRAAGVKTGLTVFPCLVRNFDSDTAVAKYVLFANQHRDSDSDPLLRARRYKLHEAQLTADGFKGSKRKEIARRMGLSMQMADRYEALSSIIEPVWALIAEGKIGVSSVHKMATHTVTQQEDIVKVFHECLEAGHKLTREVADMIIEAYRNNAGAYISFEELIKNKNSSEPEIRDSGLPLSGIMNTDPAAATKEPSKDRRNETKPEHDPIGAEHDKMDEAQADWENENSETPSKPTPTEYEKEANKEVKKEVNNANAILSNIEKLDYFLNGLYTFENPEDAEMAINAMASLAVSFLNAMNSISMEYKKPKAYKDSLNKVSERLEILKK
jgi:ParB/RepB/Spo0J family partition protein